MPKNKKSTIIISVTFFDQNERERFKFNRKIYFQSFNQKGQFSNLKNAVGSDDSSQFDHGPHDER
jgi:hypothetical protein